MTRGPVPDRPLGSDRPAAAAAQPPPPPRRKKRRSSSLVRKDEMRQLESQLTALRRRLRQLSARGPLELRAQVDANHMTLVGAQSMLSAYTGSCWSSPFSTSIRLPADTGQRHACLAAMYDHKVERATQLLMERTRFLDLGKEHAHAERFEMPSGDFVVTRFEIAPFGRVFSVRRIFDEMVYFTSQVEMSITDHTGVVAVVEQDDSPSPCVRQSRIVAAVGDGLDVETNFVIFSKFSERDAQGVLAFDCVDDDERYPSNDVSRGRLRCEVVGGGLVTETPAGNVSVARWASVRIPKPLFSLSRRQEIHTREVASAIGEVMVKAMQEKLGLR